MLSPFGPTATEALLAGRLSGVSVVSEAGGAQFGAVEATPSEARENKADSHADRENVVNVLFVNVISMKEPAVGGGNRELKKNAACMLET